MRANGAKKGPHGHGVLTNPAGWRFEGAFEGMGGHCLPIGRGIVTKPDGSTIEGEFHGEAVVAEAVGRRYEGEYRDGEPV